VSDLVTWVRAQWDRTGGFALLAAGAVLLLSGWVGVSGTSDRPAQLSYLVSGGLGGLFCLAAGSTLLLFADLGDEWRKLDELSGVLHQHHVSNEDGPGLRKGLLVAVAVSAVVLAVGWFWASGASDGDAATPGLLLSLAALVAAGLVEGTALGRARRSFTRRKATLVDAVSARWPVLDLRSQEPEPAALGAGTVLTVEGLRRFHRPSCPTMAGVAAVPVPRDQVSPDLLPCQLCEAQ
jgi:hypothetical protein